MNCKISMIVGIILTPLLAFAGGNVGLKNGNFFVGYTDCVMLGGIEVKLQRIYNSKSGYTGVYGRGWGSEFEVHASVASDGSIVVYEFGGGAANRFIPKNFRASDLKKAVALISAAAKKSGQLSGAKIAKEYESKLENDPDFRESEWDKFVQAKRLKPVNVPEGTKFYSKQFSFQYLEKKKGYYVRYFENGREQVFDNDGRLVKISDKNNNFLKLSYDKAGQLITIVDNFNRKVYFDHNKQGRISQIKCDGKVAKFSYDKLGNLTKSSDVNKNVYGYSYDKQQMLDEIVYSDKTKVKLDYWGPDKYRSVKYFKRRDGSFSNYDYVFKGANQDYRKISVLTNNDQGKMISKASYEYTLKHKENGQEWTYQLVQDIDGDRTDTIYNECCGLPVMINKRGQVTKFEYNAKGSVTKKTTPTEVTSLEYDGKFGKVTRVRNYSRDQKKLMNWSEFRYDKSGNLVYAKNSEKKGVKLFYDRNGRIKMMVDQGKNKITFKYDPSTSKPVEISDPKMGSIIVTYNSKGEIKSVDSKAGRKIAMQVTRSFQNLLDIIRPAGVTLTAF